MDNKQEELETTVQKESCDVVTLPKTWWAGGRMAGKQPSRKGPGVLVDHHLVPKENQWDLILHKEWCGQQD